MAVSEVFWRFGRGIWREDCTDERDIDWSFSKGFELLSESYIGKCLGNEGKSRSLVMDFMLPCSIMVWIPRTLSPMMAQPWMCLEPRLRMELFQLFHFSTRPDGARWRQVL